MKKILLVLLAGGFVFSGCAVEWGGRRIGTISPKQWESRSCGEANVVLISKGEYNKEVRFYKRIDRQWHEIKRLDLGLASNGRSFYRQREGAYEVSKRCQQASLDLRQFGDGQYMVVIAPYTRLLGKKLFRSHRAEWTYPFPTEYSQLPHSQRFYFVIGNDRSHRLLDGCWVDALIETEL